MKEIFKALGIDLQEDNGTRLDLLIIPNPDGSPRWIQPARLRQPHFFKFYAANSFRARVWKAILSIIFHLRLHRIVFQKASLCASSWLVNKSASADLYRDKWALFTGTIGPNRKMILWHQQGEEKTFRKIPFTDAGTANIEHEYKVIKSLSGQHFHHWVLPEISRQDHSLVQQDLSENGRQPTELGAVHLDAFSEWYHHFATPGQPSHRKLLKTTRDTLLHLQSRQEKSLPQGLIRKLLRMSEKMDARQLLWCRSHGDFTPWNTRVHEDTLLVYDWELARTQTPLFYDAFHFIIQTGILVKRHSWREIREDIEMQIPSKWCSFWLREAAAGLDEYLKWFLLIHITYYLELYSRQSQWHQQVAWQIEVWNEAISSMLAITEDDRGLVTSDLIDFLGLSRQYAALKFPWTPPEEISENSDIDLCLPRPEARKLLHTLSKHPLVAGIYTQRQSFMDHVEVITVSGALLQLDLIWKIKRKHQVFMDAHEVIEEAICDAFGTLHLNPAMTAEYLMWFYGLNAALVPDRYQMMLQHGRNKKQSATYQATAEPQKRQQLLKELLKQNRENQGLRAWWNRCLYICDVLRRIGSSRGMIITFSGVDGAGKSTVISRVKQILERKWRKPVIVLRHRPSLLPILSAWTKGKAEAEKQAANTLPRQGNNISLINSLVRFSYYYTDYVLGQFYIYFKYVRRGYIVLYDRYYFDFINDSKRSNIMLPKSWLRAGYRLLLKPDLNFFLFADPSIIRNRKQELDQFTIERLTQDYLELFASLNSPEKPRYHAVENLDLEDTLAYIDHEATIWKRHEISH